MCGVTRAFRHQVDEEILDRTAALFARHGFAHASLKSLADAVGLSKAGLLHHYPSKDALYAAAREVSRALSRHVLEQIAPLPPGAARDRRAIELLTDAALDRPGLVALAVRSINESDPGEELPAIESDTLLSEVFGVGPVDHDDAALQRRVRVVGALSALAVLSLAANHAGDKTAWRPKIVLTCCDALGHVGHGASSDSSRVGA